MVDINFNHETIHRINIKEILNGIVYFVIDFHEHDVPVNLKLGMDKGNMLEFKKQLDKALEQLDY
jgi:hypothetical protein